MPHFQTILKRHRLYPSIKRTANWMLVTIDLSVYYQWCRSSSREPYIDNFHNILKIYFILFYLHLDTAPLKIVEDWKKAIDFNQYTAAVFVDLSKAFDCLPQDLLILKLEAYGLSKSALNLMYILRIVIYLKGNSVHKLV